MVNNTTSELRKRVMEDDALYQRFGKKLEQEHKGEFVAISREGAVIISKSDIEVLKKALEQFGSGNFAFRRIGIRLLESGKINQYCEQCVSSR